MKRDLHTIRPYGDTLNDGIVQLSFTLPTPHGEEAKEGARLLALQMGFKEPQVVHSESLGEGFSFFVIYGHTDCSLDLSKVKVDSAKGKPLSKQEIEELIQTTLGRKLTIIGACIESDAHTVGIDAIMNMKGYNGHKGLEAFHGIDAINLGAQVSAEELVARARKLKADAILVSQVVTQKNIHIMNLTRLTELLEAEGLRERLVLVAGGPRISNQLAKELGYDAGFGTGTYAEDVAAFVAAELKRREFSQN